MFDWVLNLASGASEHLQAARLKRRWDHLRALGMKTGEGVNLPASTWIDASHCFLISIGNWCGFGEQCLILAHDAQMDEFLDAGLMARVVIHDSCHIGSRTVILPGVEIGPRTIVGANSVVSRSLPADTVCAGAPARVICSLEEYLDRHRQQLATRPSFSYSTHNIQALTPERRSELLAAVADGCAYLTGGFSEELEGRGGTPRTPFEPGSRLPGINAPLKTSSKQPR
jgi:maltose O-acetyltransferase